MCFGLPGNDPAGQAFRNSPSGQIRDKIFGRGTSQRLTNVVDDVHLSLTDPLAKAAGINQRDLGLAPGSFFGRTSGDVDFKAEKKVKNRQARLANQERTATLLTDPNRSPLLG